MFMSNVFGDYLTNMIEERGLTIRELSRRSGVDASQISRMISSERTIMPETIVKLARWLGRPAAEVFCAVVDITLAEKDPQYLALRGMFEAMDPKDRQTILDMMQFLLSK